VPYSKNKFWVLKLNTPAFTAGVFYTQKTYMGMGLKALVTILIFFYDFNI